MGKQHRQPEKKETTSVDKKSFFREIQIEFLIHDMKDPVAVIKTGTSSLLDKKEKYGPLSVRQEKTLERILRNTKKVEGMLNDLLEIGRSESGHFTYSRFYPAETAYDVLIDALETMVGNIYEKFRVYKGEEEKAEFMSGYGIFLDISPGLIHTEMFQDEIKFSQIIGNLIKNALYHRKERIEIKMQQEKDNFLFEISDDGKGIDPEHHKMIFQRYTRVNESTTLMRKGHGLGLAGALISARSIGGNVEVKSKKGTGATFRFILPITFKKDTQ